MRDAEKLTGISNQQVSRWRKALKDWEKYRGKVAGAAYRKAMMAAEENPGIGCRGFCWFWRTLYTHGPLRPAQ